MATQQIQVRRGTEANRAVLSAPADGEPIWVNDEKTLWMGDGSTTGGVPACPFGTLLQCRTTANIDVNAAATNNLILWGAQTHSWGSDITHSTSTNTHLFTVDTAGDYEISVNVPCDTTATPTRWNGMLYVYDVTNTAQIGPHSECGYIRMTGGQETTSLHIASFIHTFAASEQFDVRVDRASTATGTVRSIRFATYILIKRLR